MLEGAWFDHSIILARFPSSEDVTKFWNSPEYAEVKALRKGGGIFQVFSLKGENAEPPEGHPAYLISVFRPFDADAYEAIAAQEADKLSGRNMYYLATAGEGDSDRVEGDLVNFNFSIIACPTQPSATALWNDPSYADIRNQRAQVAGVNTFFMAGMAR